MKIKANIIMSAAIIMSAVVGTAFTSGSADASSSVPSMTEIKNIILKSDIPESGIDYDIDKNGEIDVFDYMTLKQKKLYPEPQVSQTVTTVKETTACDSMNHVLSKSGYKLNDVEQSKQLVTVESDGMKCTVKLFVKNDNSWAELRSTNGIVGKNGVSKDKHEGDYRTPAGLFNFGITFGINNMDGVKMEYRKITSNSYWVDDVSSPYYNKWVETGNVNFASAEHLIRYPEQYKYAAVIGYNTDPVVKNAGSAIFLHCAVGSYTAGCVAVPEQDMLYILKWLGPSCRPMILIC